MKKFFLLVCSALIVLQCGIAHAGWMDGTISSTVVNSAGDVEVILDTGSGTVWRSVLAQDMNKFLSVVLTAQANSSSVSLYHTYVDGVKGWTQIKIVSE